MVRLLLKYNTQGTVYSVRYVLGHEIHRTLQSPRTKKASVTVLTVKAHRCVVFLLQHCVRVLLMCNLSFNV
jgi:hypothetical protein